MSQQISVAYVFRSESNPAKTYQTLEYEDGGASCDCPGWKFKKKTTANGERTCKHTRFVDMGVADAHCESKIDYNRPVPARTPVMSKPLFADSNTRRKFDFDV